MKIKSHSESHIVELEDGSRWQIFPGDLDLTLDWQPRRPGACDSGVGKLAGAGCQIHSQERLDQKLADS